MFRKQRSIHYKANDDNERGLLVACCLKMEWNERKRSVFWFLRDCHVINVGSRGVLLLARAGWMIGIYEISFFLFFLVASERQREGGRE